ncbi:hypothetical protein YDYSY3_39610 [Paenibacillus chitinolyticus]|nr:hypothetical protein YDYSY3_39610 [Paenibacillus chitinolyticus]
MSYDQLMKELDFILTHPLCKSDNLEHFYHTSLYIYETIPLYVILNSVHEKKPQLLQEWSTINEVVSTMLAEMELESNLDNELIELEIKSNELNQHKGFYSYLWETDMKEELIKFYFKQRKIIVKCLAIPDLKLTGFIKKDTTCTLYLKKGRV